ncbi:zinc-binding dehydrogenase [Shewanella intestini]|uniref:Zinc-binding dehydrogenase n=1 Tax=Shewanella intestini TaxID=2017544 RepID=A0ABS5HYE7_9GAMM|nr:MULTISPECIES: zinc-binding dehydrogenase [Shewanella]MBR9726808.1 zinc-binding dehydrogenase [Shewanella intestini]MRG34626.1 zinc-binding dehydrogenase [Shewanella sp. XMDDZSB0408]
MLTIPSNMNTIELHQRDCGFELQMATQAVPQISGTQLLVKIEYVALNQCDARLSKQGFKHWQYPHILGFDAVGTVVQAEKGIFPIVGSKVLFNASQAEQGMLKEYTAIPNYAVTVVPEGITNDLAVVLPTSGMAALLAIEKLQLQQGDAIAISNAQDGVGHFAIQYAKQKGAQVFALAPKAHHKRLRKLGADFTINCQSQKIGEQIKHELGQPGFDCIINNQGGDSFIEDLNRLRFGGRIACLNGFNQPDPDTLFEKSPNIHVISVGGAWLSNSLCAQQHLGFMGEKLLNDIGNGDIIAPQIEHIEFNVAAIDDALEKIRSNTLATRPTVKIC